MRRPIIYAQEQGRSYDVLQLARETLFALGMLTGDLAGSTSTLISGLVATPTGPASLTVNLAAGRVYQLANVDTAQYGTLAQDVRQVLQQGFYLASTVLFSTSGLASGQSRWALIQATFTQSDVIPTDDPNAGVLPYWNSNNPASPLLGPGGLGAAQNTRRDSVCTVAIKYGAVATTGSEVAPLPDTGYVGLYLVDLSFGQTQITAPQILVAGPSVGTGVAGNYPQAPFLAGLLNSHHSGGAGQAPQVKLASEVQGILPLGNLPASSARAGGGIGTVYVFAGNPNTFVAGTAGVAGTSPPDFVWDTTHNDFWVCTTSGNAAAAVWSVVNMRFRWGGTSIGSANSQQILPADYSSVLNDGDTFAFLAGFANTGATVFQVGIFTAKPLVRPDAVSALQAGDIPVGGLIIVTWSVTANAFVLHALPSAQIINQSPGRLLTVNTYTVHGTYTWNRPANCNSTIGRLAGAAGGGASANATAANHGDGGGGGGAGGYTEGQNLSPPASWTVTIPQGGTGGASGALNSGGNGSAAASIGSWMVANSGNGGSAGLDQNPPTRGAGGAGGTVSTAGNLISFTGQNGADGSGSGGNSVAIGGAGGSGPLGQGGASVAAGADQQTTGLNGSGWGAGGSGGAANDNTTTKTAAGGNGTDGGAEIKAYS